MSPSQVAYHPLDENGQELDDNPVVSGDRSPSPAYRDDEDDSHALLIPAQSQSHTPPTSYRRYRACVGRRLSKTCITVTIVVIAVVVAIIGGGGYLTWNTPQIDGQSPPFYPTPQGGTVSSWHDSYEKASKMVDRMSLVEKVNITTGVGWAMGFCVGNTGPATSVGFPSLCLQDGPLGIRFSDHATSFPAGITVGATWNRDLMYRRGAAHARQAKLKGVNVLLGPSMGPIGRHPAGGRNWEGFGSDPVLQAVAASRTIRGIQDQGVIATAKHYVGNEQEHFRKSYEWGLPEALSSNIDDRTLHELYIWPFAESIRAGVASVMCSYQMVNNSYACANSKLMNGILKDELGFQGFVQSDWLAQRSGVASALAGLDMSMPGDGMHWLDGKSFFGQQMTLAALNGSLPMSRVNDMAMRTVAAWYQLGQDDWNIDGPNFSSWTDDEYGKQYDGSSSKQQKVVVNKFVETEDDASRDVARQVAAEGTVLLKNEDSVLPLDRKLANIRGGRVKHIAIIGQDAGAGKGPNHCADRACNQGTLAVGWGSGATEFTYLVDPFTALNKTFDHKQVEVTASLTNKMSTQRQKMLPSQDLCIVFANADAGEGYLAWNGIRADRNDLELQLDGGDLVRKVAASCGGPTVLVVHAVGPVMLEAIANITQVKAIVHANLPGQESGNALADVLFGRVDASGRLPFTIGKSEADHGPSAPVLYYPNHIIPQADFEEGLYIDYRHFDNAGIEPLYEFGYGMSYTTFEYSNLSITNLKPRSQLPTRPSQVPAPKLSDEIPDASAAVYPSGFRRLKKYIYPYIKDKSQVKYGKYHYPRGYDQTQPPSPAGGGEGGHPALFEEHVQIDLQVKNTGSRKGKEVVQLYVSIPEVHTTTGQVIDMPVRVLRNFTKLEIEAGVNTPVTLTLSRKDLSYWSVVEQNWMMPDVNMTLSVGRSSRDIKLEGFY